MLALVLDAKVVTVLLIWFLRSNVRGGGLRIIGGQDKEPNEFPYVIRMEVKFLEKAFGLPHVGYVHICTAAAITTSWTLTAAHCVTGLDEILEILQSQPTREQATGILRYESETGYPSEYDNHTEIISTHNYPTYKMHSLETGEMVYNDVALLKTAPMKLIHYGKISAADFTTLSGQRAYAVGFGLTDKGALIMSTMVLGKTLQVLNVIIKYCNNMPLGLYPNLCVSRPCGQSAALCSGDSGGPLIHASGIVGINSKGIASDCQKKYHSKKLSSNIVGVITPISPYLEWIADRIREDHH